MKKHQFVKKDCNCSRRATFFVCKCCGTVEYSSPHELRVMNSTHAMCSSPDAPAVPPYEVFRGMLGGTFDCLAPDFETFLKNAALADSGA